MKWRNRTAQAFRPGKVRPELALKGRPNRLGATRHHTIVDNDTCGSKLTHFGRPFSNPNPADAGCNSDLVQYSNTPILHHSAWPDSRTRTRTKAPGTYPGLKAWAILSDHFMANLSLDRWWALHLLCSRSCSLAGPVNESLRRPQ